MAYCTHHDGEEDACGYTKTAVPKAPDHGPLAAVRSVKLGFLQLIAPIPILSNAIPGPKGKEMFKKWYTNCISTYLGLFLKLIVFYFAVYLIGLVGASGFYSASGMSQSTSPNILGKIFVILGVLMFVNQLPQLISDITGAKMDGDFTLNPMKKIGQSTFASAAVGGAAGLLGGAAANTWANIVNTKKAHSKILDNHGNKIKYKNMTDEQKRQFKEMGGRHGLQFAGSFLGGAAGGAFQSGKSMVANKGQFFRSLGTGVGASSDNRRRRDNGFGFGDRISSYAHDAAGLTNKSGTSSQIKKQMFDLQQEAAGRREWVASAKHNLELEAANSAYSSGYRYLSEQLTYIGPDEDGNPKYMGGTDHPEYSDYFAKTGAISNVTDFEAEAKSGRFVGESWYEDLIKSGASVDSMYDSYLDSRGVMTEETFESVADQYRNIGTRQAEAADYDKKVKDLQDTLDKKPQPKK